MRSDVWYIDANVLMYLLEGDQRYSTAIADTITQHYAGGGRLVTSAITITEFLAGPTQASRESLEMVPDLQIMPMDVAIAEQAGLLRRTHNLKPIDALHLASAIDAQADQLFTYDKPFAKIAAQYLPLVTV